MPYSPAPRRRPWVSTTLLHKRMAGRPPPVLRPARTARDCHPPRLCGYARLRLAARDHRLSRRRRLGVGAGSDQCLADPVPDLSGADLAGGRLRRRTPERHHGRGGRRLVLRLRLFPRWTILGRLRLPGRCQDLRLVAAGGGRWLAGLSRVIYCARTCGRALDLGARAGARAGAGRHAHRSGVAARPSAQRISLEHFRLCPDRAASAGAKRLAGRYLGPHLPLHRDLRQPGRARRRLGGHSPSAARAVHRRPDSRRPRELWRCSAMAASDRLCERREAARHAAQSATGREIQLCRQSAGHGTLFAPIYRATGPNSNGVHDVTHLIWPESAFPFFLTREPDALAQITGLLKPSTELITGAVRAAPTASASNPHAYNSVYVIDPDGSIRGIYDKVHLVPFGEYLPLQRLLERLGLKQLTKMVGGFQSGDRRRAMDVPGAPKMLPLICYEAIFPGTAVPRGERPGWLVNVTNDGWFGISSGSYQHFQQARVLAIAEGLPLVRAANTGISAVVDPVGRIVNSLPLGAEGVLDSRLPSALEPTAYVRFGDGIMLLFLVVSLVMVGRRRMHP